MDYQSDSIGELAKALSAAQGEMDAAKKDSKGNYGKYTTISSILEVVKDALSRNGLAVVQAPMPCESGCICLRTTLMHTSGQWIASQLTMKAENVSPQKIGSVITYARRYALAALLGVGQEDDDAQAAQDAYEKQARKAQKEAVQQVRQQAAANNPDPATAAQLKAIMACLQSRGIRERDDCLAELDRFLGRSIASSKELTRTEASDFLEANKPESAPVNDNPF
jgi:hypothetical protein